MAGTSREGSNWCRLVGGILLACLGCSTSSIEVYVIDHGLSVDAALAEAELILDLDIDRVDTYKAPVTLEIVEVLDPASPAHALHVGHCKSVVRSAPIPLFISHEFGHALGLEHVADTSNLMSSSASGDLLTDSQRARMEDRAWKLQTEACSWYR